MSATMTFPGLERQAEITVRTAQIRSVTLVKAVSRDQLDGAIGVALFLGGSLPPLQSHWIVQGDGFSHKAKHEPERDLAAEWAAALEKES